MFTKRINRSVVGTVVSGAVLSAFLLLTRPHESNLGLSFAPLIFLWIFVYFIGGIIAHVFARGRRVGVVRALRIITASSATLLVMFNALGDVSILDSIILFALSALGSFYFSRTWRA